MKGSNSERLQQLGMKPEQDHGELEQSMMVTLKEGVKLISANWSHYACLLLEEPKQQKFLI